MQSNSKLTIPTKEFKLFLSSLAKINDSTILEIQKDKTYSIIASDDRSMFLWSELISNFPSEESLSIPSLSKLSNLLDMVGGSDITFTLKKNKLEYRGNTIKFDIHLFDDGILAKPKITLNKIKSLKFDYEFEVSKQFIKAILKNSSIFKDTNKLYIYTEDDNLVWSLADRTKTNTDNMTIIGGNVDFEMDDFILNLDNIRLIDFGDSDKCKFEINNDGVGIISITNGNLNLNYIVTSLTK